MAATSSATSTATSSAVINGDLVNVNTGDPAQEKYPGAVSPQQYTDEGPSYPLEGPVQGGSQPSPYGALTPGSGSGGGIIDLSFTTGTDGPQERYPEACSTPVALSFPGARPPALHADDGSGAVAAAQTVVPAFIGQLLRKTPTGQTYNRQWQFDTVNGQWVPSPNGRIDYDQIQMHDPAPGDGGGYAPWDPGYAERPVLLNVAYQATPVTSVNSQYGVNGFLPDRSQWQAYQAETYAAPPDPIANPTETPAVSNGSGWLLG
jgi:hypothetical protein